MRSSEEIDRYLYDLGLPCSQVDDDMWVLSDAAGHLENIVVYRTEKVLNFRVKVTEIPPTTSMAFYRELLHLNASEMVHGAYGIEKDSVVLVGALEVENLDLNEIQAMIDAFTLAVSAHHDRLEQLLGSRDGAAAADA